MAIVEPQKKSLIRRFLDQVIAWEDAMGSSGFDYALDRIAGLQKQIAELEKQVAELRDELRRSLPRS